MFGRPVFDLPLDDWHELLSLDRYSFGSYFCLVRAFQYVMENKFMASFKDLPEEDRDLVLVALDDAIRGCEGRASRSTLPSVETEFRKQADKMRMVKSRLVLKP